MGVRSRSAAFYLLASGEQAKRLAAEADDYASRFGVSDRDDLPSPDQARTV